MRTNYEGFRTAMYFRSEGHIAGETPDGFYSDIKEFEHIITDYILDHYCLDQFGEVTQQAVPSEATKRHILMDCIKCNAYLFSEFLSDHLNPVDLLAGLVSLLRPENSTDFWVKNQTLNRAWEFLIKIIEEYLYDNAQKIFGIGKFNPYLDLMIDEAIKERQLEELLARKN